MDFAVIKTGGKQYVVSSGKKIKVEKLEVDTGKDIVFDQVLLLEKSGKTEIGAPLLEGVKVTGKVVLQGKAEKVIALRYKAKKRVHVKKGHRQKYTEVEITKLN